MRPDSVNVKTMLSENNVTSVRPISSTWTPTIRKDARRVSVTDMVYRVKPCEVHPSSTESDVVSSVLLLKRISTVGGSRMNSVS